MSAADGGAGHGLVDRVADESLQVALGRRRQTMAADRGRSFRGEDARSAADVSVSFGQLVDPDRWFAPRPMRDDRAFR